MQIPSNVDLKELLDEKKLRITFSDIVRDYLYFRKEYYYFDEKTYQYNHYNNRPDVIDKETYLPFNSKTITLKKVYNFIFKTTDSRKILIYNGIMTVIVINLLSFFISYKYKKYTKKNLDSVLKLSESS